MLSGDPGRQAVAICLLSLNFSKLLFSAPRVSFRFNNSKIFQVQSLFRDIAHNLNMDVGSSLDTVLATPWQCG